MDKRKMGPRPDVSPKEQVKLLGRIIKYTFSRYKFSCICYFLDCDVGDILKFDGQLEADDDE